MYTSIGDQQTIIESFQNVLKFADRMFTVVLVVGNDEQHKLVLTLKSKHFKPQNSCRNPPRVIHIPTNIAQTLKGKNAGDVKWAYNAEDVDKKIHEYISNNESFVFYRHGSYSNVRKSADEAVTEICKICRDEYLLVVGDDTGIESNIQQDIQIVAYLAGLHDSDLQNLCEMLQQPSDDNNQRSHFIGNNAVFTLLVLPNVDYLKKELKEEIQRPYKMITVIYSGHGSLDGSWALYDGSFSASDLMEVLSNIPKLQHNLKLRVYLNCCYGLKFATEVALNTNLLDIFIEDIKSSGKVPFKLKSWNIEHILGYAKNPCSDGDTGCHRSLNDCITDQMIKMWQQVRDFIPLNVNVNNFSGFILPFAFGPLDPEPADPQLIVFPGANGDSTLFRWHNFNMLVDGGWLPPISRPSMSPCFWETIRRLPENQKLDIVVVTHYDEDHIAGILRLFEEKDGLPIEVGKLYTVKPPSNKQPTTRSAKQGNDLWERGRSSLKCMEVLNLNTDCKKSIFSRRASATGDCLYIYMVTPTEANLHKARQDMRALSPPNIGSASLLIKCFIQSANDHRYALLTGDAPPQAIINGLDTLKTSNLLDENAHQDNHYSFDYVDMPHHGAYKENPDCLDNNPQLFLSHIHTKACVVSTNGKKYGHPNDETLKFLKQSLERETIRRLFFTYNKRNKEDIRPKFAEQVRNCVFANNNPSTKNPTKCFLFNLCTHQYGECETNQVIKAHCTHSYM